MRPCREIALLVTLILVALILGAPFAGAASAQKATPETTQARKATAPDKMMPPGDAPKMRECEKRAQRQKIKMADRADFVDRCVAGEVK